MNKYIEGLKRFTRFSLEALPPALSLIGVLLVGAAVLSLMTADVFTGAVSILEMSQNETTMAILISLATTGLLIGFMALVYTAINNKWDQRLKWAFIAIAAILFAIDFYFDMRAADVIRYGQFINLGSLVEPEYSTHILFRVLLGGISCIGEALAATAIMALPLLNQIFKNVVQNQQTVESH